jgi:AraC family transcriptional regulator, regulatory protein of adaptative response / methylated-DNA-[protein]-cysteine methyltransferase
VKGNRGWQRRVGARQLSRLFAGHLNASPIEVAKTARVQRAKHLLDSTDLAMTEVAIQAGFRSLRRFNTVFIEVYRISPTEVRRLARTNGRGPGAANRSDCRLQGV